MSEMQQGHLDPEQLKTMTKAELEQMAEDMGLNTDGLKTKADLIAAIAAEPVFYTEEPDDGQNGGGEPGEPESNGQNGGGEPGESENNGQNDSGESGEPESNGQNGGGEPGEPEGSGQNGGGEPEEPEERDDKKRMKMCYVGPSLPGGFMNHGKILYGTEKSIGDFLEPVVKRYPQVEHLMVPQEKFRAALSDVKNPGKLLFRYAAEIKEGIKRRKAGGKA